MSKSSLRFSLPMFWPLEPHGPPAPHRHTEANGWVSTKQFRHTISSVLGLALLIPAVANSQILCSLQYPAQTCGCFSSWLPNSMHECRIQSPSIQENQQSLISQGSLHKSALSVQTYGQRSVLTRFCLHVTVLLEPLIYFPSLFVPPQTTWILPFPDLLFFP